MKINAGRELAWYYDGDWRMRYASALELVTASRPLIEAIVAARVRGLPNVAFREATRLAAPVIEARAVYGVQLAGGNPSEIIPADLLVDATGRGSALPRRLEQLGQAAPRIESIPADGFSKRLTRVTSRWSSLMAMQIPARLLAGPFTNNARQSGVEPERA